MFIEKEEKGENLVLFVNFSAFFSENCMCGVVLICYFPTPECF